MIVLLFSTSVKDLNTVSTEELFCDSLFSGTDHLGVTRRVTHFSRRDISNSISRHSANTTPSDKLTLQFVSCRLAPVRLRPVLTVHVAAVNGGRGPGAR